MSTQVVRVEGYNKGSLGTIGRECDRADVNHRNGDIDKKLSYLNQSYKDAPLGFKAEYEDIKTSLNASGKEAKNVIAFEGMVITADRAFFERLGWKSGEPEPQAVKDFFDRSYAFAKEQVGYNGTDKNFLSAKVHYDEKTPHMHVYYIPVTDEWQEKIYQKDENGHVLRSEKGTPLQAKGANGKVLYRDVTDKEHPRISKAEFWRQRGGAVSYHRMQDLYQERVGAHFGLERGEIGSDREHRTKSEYEAARLAAEKKDLVAEVEPYRQMKVSIDEVDIKGTAAFGKVLMNQKTIDELKEQAKSYAANREDIEHLRQKENRLRLLELEVDRRAHENELRADELRKLERKVAAKEEFLDREIAKQPELNEVNKDLEQQNHTLQTQINSLEKALKQNEKAYSAKLTDIENKNRGHFRDFEWIRKMYADTVQAIGMFMYDKESGYQALLPEKAVLLVNAVYKAAEESLRAVGDTTLANSVKGHYGLSRNILEYIEIPKEKDPIQEYAKQYKKEHGLDKIQHKHEDVIEL